jgi:hypothetical protein
VSLRAGWSGADGGDRAPADAAGGCAYRTTLSAALAHGTVRRPG